MLRLFRRVVGNSCILCLLFSPVANFTWAQSETATVSGQVVDPSGLNITGAQVKLVDIDRDTSTSVTTNSTGLYTFSSVKPGRYRMEVSAAGFRVVNVTGVTVNIQDHLEQNFKLVVGSISESMTVTADAFTVNTTDATVSTVVDRNFAENLPMNGRSFQTLIQLTPGVVLTASNAGDAGQFSVNGQRAASNYWMVDGVSANIGIGVSGIGAPGNGLAGALGSFGVQGGTNSLVSVDALQEFRIQTSTFAPEFGRTPGGQISILTRSGTNQFHGTAFDYLRNDILDASDWFNGYTNSPPLAKAEERQNDFGGTFSGPIVKGRTFFFFSYEGLRLRLPQTELTTVPDIGARQDAIPAMRPFLNAFPEPNGTDDVATGIAAFNASYSNPSRLNAYSLRIDHKFNDRLNLFGRYNYSPSSLSQRGGGGLNSLSSVNSTQITTQTATVGTTWTVAHAVVNDLRLNYSRVSSASSFTGDNFGGAIPLTSLPFPNPFTAQNALFYLSMFSLQEGSLEVGKGQQNVQRQINVVDGLAIQEGPHSLKVGVDFRRLSPIVAPFAYSQEPLFSDVPSAETGILFGTSLSFIPRSTFLFRNFGVYAEDTWRAFARLALTYGIRWDVDFVPKSINGPSFNAVNGFNLNNLSNLALAPAGTPPYKTAYGNFAPRVGLAYQLFPSQGWQSVLRGGFGVFYDLASSEAGNSALAAAYPFGSAVFPLGGTFPLSPAAAAPPPITPPNVSNGETLYGFDPHLKLPFTLEWNMTFEQALGGQQIISASYIGSAGRRLLQTASITSPNADLSAAQLVTNAGASDYDALQVQFQRRLSRGLQILASYTWSHSIDDGSAGSGFLLSNLLVPADINANRGPSDFDIRNGFSAAVTYNIPLPRGNPVAKMILEGWSTENVIQARSAPPVDVSDTAFSQLGRSGINADVRPDLVFGQPPYLFGPQCLAVFGNTCPGGKGFNSAAFTDPPFDPSTLIPLRQGSTPRNYLRGFGAAQWDFAVHREFPIHESLKLQFRAEMFNILNHPNFGPPSGAFLSPQFGGPGQFGLSTQMLGQSLNHQNQGGGAFSPLYQIGGPRSVQLALKLIF